MLSSSSFIYNVPGRVIKLSSIAVDSDGIDYSFTNDIQRQFSFLMMDFSTVATLVAAGYNDLVASSRVLVRTAFSHLG